MQNLNLFLKNIEIFREIPADILEEMARDLEITEFTANSPVLHKGAEGNSMYVILNGKVKVHDEEHVVANLGAGNFFGEFSLLDDAPRSMSVTTSEKSSLVKIGREQFYKLMQDRPEVGRKLVSTLTGRVRKQNESIIADLKSREQELTRLVDEKTKELRERNEEITLKNKEITDNIRYAKHIQSSILPDIKEIQKVFPDSFVLYLPKDIVSGDFYYFYQNDEWAVIIAADCTGHGVTGAFLSVAGHSILNRIIRENGILDPGRILDELHESLIDTLNQRYHESSDGMDLSVCILNLKTGNLLYAGANRPVWIIRKDQEIILKPDKFPVGGMQILRETSFSTEEFQLQTGDSIYLFSDGYADQFGGPAGKKIMTKNFREKLVSIKNLKMQEQQTVIEDYFDKWKGKLEQIDDVLVIGIRI